MKIEQVWVIAFNKEDGKREKFALCPKNNSKFYEELYAGEGYNVRVMTEEEVDELIKFEKNQ